MWTKCECAGETMTVPNSNSTRIMMAQSPKCLQKGNQNLRKTSSSTALFFVIILMMALSSSTNLFVMGPSAVSAAMAFPSSTSTRQLDFYRPDKTFMMTKRSATALNKLMIALRSYEKTSAEKGNDGIDVGNLKYGSGYDTFNLQRRNQKDRKIYKMCYFNAVSCF